MKFPLPLCAALLCLAALPAHAQTDDANPMPDDGAAPTELPAIPDDVGPLDPGVPLDPQIYQTFSTPNRDNDPAWAKFASNGGSALYLAAGTFLPLLTDGKAGGQQTLRTADALIVSTLIAEGLKQVTHEKRPDGTDFQSFPSGHTTAAFTVAAMQSHYHPRQALLWYAGASAIGASRVVLDRHYTRDVVAGAALGYFSAQLELKQGRGLILRPFVRPEAAGGRAIGLSVGGSF